MNKTELARMIDHTQLRAHATQEDITRLCDEAIAHGFAAVSINPVWASYCAKRLAGADVQVDAVVGFPLGASTAHVKVEEARDAVRNGATEIDMVINIGALKSGFPQFVEREIAAVVQGIKAIPVKVIIEACYLTNEEKAAVCQMCVRAGAAFVKTSTGFGESGATVEDVRLLRQTVGNAIGVKAAGGIRSFSNAWDLIQAGASRIGTSASVTILAEAEP